MSIVLQKGKTRVRLTPEETSKIKNCSDFIKHNLEFMDSDEEERVFSLESNEFTEQNLLDAVEYLRQLNFQPTVYRKIFTDSISQQFETDFEKELAARYKDKKAIKQLHSLAKYLQIKSLTVFALVLLGLPLKVNENQHDSLQKIKERNGITEEYDYNVEKKLKEQYEFLK
jgi:hypothetical protein